MVKRPTLQVLPVNKFANVQHGKYSGDGIHGLEQPHLRQNGVGHPRGLPKKWEEHQRFLIFLQEFRLEEMPTPLYAMEV